MIKELEDAVICEFRRITIHLRVLKMSVNKPLMAFKVSKAPKGRGLRITL